MNAPQSAIGGELGLVGLFDLSQLLMLNGATGRLVIQHKNRRGYLIFEEGRIVNAVDDEQREGEGAAYRIFSWKAGKFEFRPEAPGSPRVITEGTEALMLEAARRLDEGSDGSGAGESETTRLKERQNAMEELRDVFHRVAREATGAGIAASEPASLLLEALRDVDDRLYCRPGHAPRLLHDGSWLFASETTLRREVYEDMRGRLLGDAKSEAKGGAGTPEARRTRIVHVEDGHTVAVTCIGQGEQEALWIRLAGLPAPDLGMLDGPQEGLNTLVDAAQATILVAGPTPEAVERLVHAVVALIARRRGATVLVVAAAPIYRHDDEEGLVLFTDCEHAGEAVKALRPGASVFEAGQAPAGAVLDALQVSPLVVAGVVSADEQAAMSRWLASLAVEEPGPIEAALGAAPLGVVYTPGVPIGEDRIPFDVETVASSRPQRSAGAGREESLRSRSR